MNGKAGRAAWWRASAEPNASLHQKVQARVRAVARAYQSLDHDALGQLTNLEVLELDGNELTQLAGHTFRGNPELSYVNIEENPVEVIEAPATYLYAGHSLQCIEVFNATHREGVHLVLVVEGGRATCRHTDANSCPSGMDIWVPRSYAHAQTVVRKVGADLAALAGVYRDGAQREWNGIDWSTGEQEYAMTSAGHLKRTATSSAV